MLSKVSEFATKTFLLWMFIAAIIGFIFPTQLATMGQFVPWLLGIVMLGMGMTIKPSDFKLVFKVAEVCYYRSDLTIHYYAYLGLYYC